jgi:hypothetical protein
MHGDISKSQSLIISGEPPACLTPSSIALVSISELPFLRGLPRKTKTSIAVFSIVKKFQ